MLEFLGQTSVDALVDAAVPAQMGAGLVVRQTEAVHDEIAGLLAGLDGVELAGVVDLHATRAHEIAATYGARTFAEPRDLIGHADAVTIATPTVTHIDIAMPFVEAGIEFIWGDDVDDRLSGKGDGLRFARKTGVA